MTVQEHGTVFMQDNGKVASTKIRLSNGDSFEINSLPELVQLNALRQYLAEGFQYHLLFNPLLHEVSLDSKLFLSARLNLVVSEDVALEHWPGPRMSGGCRAIAKYSCAVVGHEAFSSAVGLSLSSPSFLRPGVWLPPLKRRDQQICAVSESGCCAHSPTAFFGISQSCHSETWQGT